MIDYTAMYLCREPELWTAKIGRVMADNLNQAFLEHVNQEWEAGNGRYFLRKVVPGIVLPTKPGDY